MRFTAEKDTRYRAVIHLGFFESVASNDTLKEKFEEVGLISVTVWGSGHDRSAEGVWPGETQEVELPSQIVSVTKL